jgi:hypothetical protein
VLKGRTLRGWELAAFLLLVMLSALIRLQSCLLMFAVGLPNLLFAAMHYCFTGRAWDGMSRRRWLCQAVFIPPALAAVVVLAGQLFDAYAYRFTPGWADYHEFNDLRARFTDYHRAHYDESTKDVFDRVGWSENDYEMLHRWFFLNEQLYNADKFRTILASMPPARSQSNSLLGLKLFIDLAFSPPLRVMVIGALVPFAFISRNGWGRLHLLLAWAALVGAIALVIFFLDRVTPWVYTPLLAFPAALALVLSGEAISSRRFLAYGIRAAVFVVLAVYVADSYRQLSRESVKVTAMAQKLESEVAKLKPRPDQLYVVWGGIFPLELILSGRDLDDWRDFKMLGTGFTTHSPINAARLREFNITNLYDALLKRPDVFLITHYDNKDAFLLYVWEHYGKRYVAVPVLDNVLGSWRGYDGSIGKLTSTLRGFTVYRFKERATPKASD